MRLLECCQNCPVVNFGQGVGFELVPKTCQRLVDDDADLDQFGITVPGAGSLRKSICPSKETAVGSAVPAGVSLSI